MAPRALLTFAAALVLLILSVAAASDLPEDPQILQVTDRRPLGATELLFRAFLQKYNKEYHSRDEYSHRLGIFARNLARAAEHQALDPTAVHGVTPFSDLTEAEFEEAFTGLASPGWVTRRPEFPTAAVMEVDGLPSSFDWREKGAVTNVKIQVI